MDEEDPDLLDPSSNPTPSPPVGPCTSVAPADPPLADQLAAETSAEAAEAEGFSKIEDLADNAPHLPPGPVPPPSPPSSLPEPSPILARAVEEPEDGSVDDSSDFSNVLLQTIKSASRFQLEAALQAALQRLAAVTRTLRDKELKAHESFEHDREITEERIEKLTRELEAERRTSSAVRTQNEELSELRHELSRQLEAMSHATFASNAEVESLRAQCSTLLAENQSLRRAPPPPPPPPIQRAQLSLKQTQSLCIVSGVADSLPLLDPRLGQMQALLDQESPTDETRLAEENAILKETLNALRAELAGAKEAGTPSQAGALSFLLADLFQVLEMQAVRMGKLKVTDDPRSSLNGLDFVLQQLRERLPAEQSEAIGSGVQNLLDRLVDLAGQRLALLAQATETQNALEQREQELEKLREEGKAEKAAAEASLLETCNAELAAAKEQIQKLEARVAKAAESEARVSDQNKRMRTLVVQANQQLVELKQTVTDLKSKLADAETKTAALDRELEDAKVQLRVMSKPPTLADLTARGIEAEVVMKVAVGSCVWCCLSASRDTSGDAEERKSRGVSWWRESDLDEALAAPDLQTLQELHFTELQVLRDAADAASSRLKEAQDQSNALRAEFDDFKKKVESVLDSRERETGGDPAPASTSFSEAPEAQSGAELEVAKRLSDALARCQELEGVIEEHRGRMQRLEEKKAALEVEIRQQEERFDGLLAEKTRTHQMEVKRATEKLENENQELMQRLDENARRLERLTARLAAMTETPAAATTTLPLSPPPPPPSSPPSHPSLSPIALPQDAAESLSPPLRSPAESQRWSAASAEFTRRSIESNRLPSGILSSSAGAPRWLTETRHLKRRAEGLEAALRESVAQNRLLEEQIELLKSEFRKSEALLQIRLQKNAEALSGVPIEYIRNTLIKFISTDQKGGSEEHEALIPVISSVFNFTREEEAQIRKARDAASSQWRHFFSTEKH